jgi:hypothetical protein
MGTRQWDLSIAQVVKDDFLIVSGAAYRTLCANQLTQHFQPAYLLVVLLAPVFLFLKSTFFILYLTLFAQLRWARICSWIGLIATTLSYTVFTIHSFALATPRKGQTWVSASQYKPLNLSTPQSILGLVIDLYILVIPVIGVSTLQLSWKRKIGVLLIFLSGIM